VPKRPRPRPRPFFIRITNQLHPIRKRLIDIRGPFRPDGFKDEDPSRRDVERALQDFAGLVVVEVAYAASDFPGGEHGYYEAGAVFVEGADYFAGFGVVGFEEVSGEARGEVVYLFVGEDDVLGVAG